MASDAPADPWSAPDNDPWNTSAWTGEGAHSVRPGDVYEPNAEASVQEQTEAGPQSSGNQEPGGGADAPAVDSWRGSDWAQRRVDNSSDGSSGDATTTGDRRASDGSWKSWTTWQSWPQQWHGGRWGDHWGNDRSGWYRYYWSDGDPTSWPTNTSGTAPTSFATDPSSTTWNSGGPGTTSTPGTPPTATAPLPSSTRSGSLSTATERTAGEPAVQGGMKGPTEKLLIPTFSGDCEGGNELGTSARSYLRQIAAWEKMTKLSAGQKALVLYQNLQGSAWVNAESLCVEDLASDSGVTYLKDWIRQHYLDVEVTQVGRSLSDLFRKLVTECGCTLPDVANAWLFVDRANLDETTEVSLLASVGNKYALRELQQAAIVLDRSIRKPWEKGTRGDAPGNRRFNSVNLAADGVFDEDDEGEEDAMLEDQVGQDTGELYISYMTAKAKYRDAARSRGGGGKKFDTQAVKKAAEAKILLAKSKSHCASCGKKGHWHRDPVCPNYEANTAAANKAQTVHVTNEIYELTACGDSSDLYAILDSACSKTVVGTGWLERYLASIKEKGFECEFVYERECFKFGAANRIYESTYAAVIMMNVLGKWLGVKAAVIHGDLPLLMSRPALGHLGLVLDLGLGKAHFRKLGEGELTLLETSSGHPAICIDYGNPDKPDVSQLPKSWEPHGKRLLLTLSLRGMDSGAPPIAVWKMTKVQLLAEANRRGLAVNSKWTCPELRTVLTNDSDYHRGPSEVPKGLSSMTIAELRQEADNLKIPLGAKETKGSLMLKIRDTTAPDSTVMTIGRFRGSSYMDIPENYGAWASEEERKNGNNMSPDLKRFVTWRRHRRAQGSRATASSRGYRDPEMDAMVPPPPLSETGSSVWGVVEDPSGSLTNWRPIPPSSSRGLHDWRPEAPANPVTPFTKAKATRRERSPEGKARMEQDVDPETLEEIRTLEARLAALKEAFLSRGALTKLGEDVTGARHHNEHPGELAATQALREGDFSFERTAEILDLYDFKGCPMRRPNIHEAPDGTRVAIGYYAYGAFKGVCKQTTRWANLTLYLNRLLREHTGGDGGNERRTYWSAITVLRDCPAAMHTDKNNLKGSPNFVVSFGGGPGGGLWVESPGGGIWRRDHAGNDIEGEIVDTDRQVCEFDPRARHASEPSAGGRWTIAAYTPRTFPDANKTEKKVLRNLGFPLPTASDIRETRIDHAKWNEVPKVPGSSQSVVKPRRSQRRAMWKTAAFLSVMFNAVLASMNGAACEAVPVGTAPAVSLLEVGGLSATCRVAEYGGDHIKVVEPILPDDLNYDDHPEDAPFGIVETAVIRHRPGQLWMHVIPNWKYPDVYNDVVDAVGRQLREGGAVIFEKNIDDDEVWESLTGGWSDQGYFTQTDFDEDGNELLRVFYDAEFPRINEVLAGEIADEEEIGEGEPDGAPGEVERDQDEGGERGAKAITFPASVPGKIASSLRRLHQNLGHPSAIDFCRHLRLAGATREVLKAAKSLNCEVCRRAKAPAIAKPAKVAPCLRFNQMIGADIFYVHDSGGDRHQLLSLVDFSSSYHVVVKIARKDTATLEKAYCEHWLNVFGAPDVIAVDLENGLEKALARVGDWTGARLRNAAGQAHYQAGYTERQGGIWKATFAKLCDELSVGKADIEVAIGAVSSAKNKLAKVSGYSPAQHVFGYIANDPDDLLNGPHAGDPGDDPIIDDRHAREVAVRHSARAAYYHVQSDERVRRALAGRSRVTARPPECGERVFYYRKTKNNKRGVWMGPGTVIGYEGVNAWVTRGGRCILCSPEHIRLATPEELGQAFSLRAARDDLDRLLNLDDEEQAFEEDVEGGVGYIDPGDEEMEEPDLPMAEVEHGEPDPPLQGVRRGADHPGPVVFKRQRRKGRQGDAHGVLMMKRARTKRSREKALEKEIPWELIPEDIRPRFRAAEGVQWAEHVDNQAIKVLSVAEFAYKDKHMGLRRVDPTADWKPKSRLVIAGHLDPDAGDSSIHTDSPTVARSSLLTVLQICATNGWTAAAGDVQAAFLQGVELKRELWMWFDRLFGVLTSEVLDYEGKEYRLVPSPLDACVLMMKEVGKDSEPIALLTVHVDDILIGAPTGVNRFLQKEISRLFPVDDWIEGAFEYTGSFINVDDEGITVNQANFVDGRLFTVEVPKNQDGKSPADEEQTIDNRSLLGALSWLSSQSRPDLACGVAMSQQLQRAPSTEDVRFVNRLTAKAKEHREHGVYLRRVDANDAVFIAYHDAGWANADLEEDESDFRLTPQEVSGGTIREFYDEDRPRRPKRPGSKVASQIGHLIMLFPYKILHGEHARGSTLEWRSQSCKRVCRSTFGAETMAAAEGLEGAQYMRALFGTLLTGRLMGHAEARRRWPIVCLSDCKSLFDFLHKAGVPKVPTDRRLAIDLAALRQELRLEKWCDRLPFQWIPTSIQLADPLTKPKRVEGWWEALANGVQLPFRKDLFRKDEESFNQCKREDSVACRQHR
ncbi:GIP [Symbiodinium sp. CCMP2592]|nr:GIP [Symbiodinium sp. CCMP2592]